MRRPSLSFLVLVCTLSNEGMTHEQLAGIAHEASERGDSIGATTLTALRTAHS